MRGPSSANPRRAVEEVEAAAVEAAAVEAAAVEAAAGGAVLHEPSVGKPCRGLSSGKC